MLKLIFDVLRWVKLICVECKKFKLLNCGDDVFVLWVNSE